MSDFAGRCIERFIDSGINPQQEFEERKVISVAEKGKKYIVNVKNDAMSAVYQVDGNIIKSGERCDKFVAAVKENKGLAIFVELKGKDIAHAIEQLETTVNNALFKPFPKKEDKTRARIVTAGCGPKSASKKIYENARIKFKQIYNINLGILRGSQPDADINF